jgi:hypothetical protein
VNTVPGQALILTGLVALIALCGSSAAESSGKGVVRDWAKYPAVLQLTTAADVIAVGDVHGDLDRLVNLLEANHLIEPHPPQSEHAQWTGGRSILICTGDMIDRWTNGLGVIRFFRGLQLSAREAAGDVIVTMGNHEAAFLASDADHQRFHEFEDELRTARINSGAVRRGDDPEGLGQFLRSLPIMAVINDWCFVHAGNFQGRTLDQLKFDLEQSITRVGFGARILSDPDSVLEARLRPKPWWEASASGPAEAEAELRKSVETIDCRHLVTGHQPKAVVFSGARTRAAGEIAAEFNGLLFLIDTGMSRGIGLSEGALLAVRDSGGAALSLSSKGQARELWRKPANGLSRQ